MTTSGNWGTCPRCKQYVMLDEAGDCKEHRVWNMVDEAFEDCNWQGAPE